MAVAVWLPEAFLSIHLDMICQQALETRWAEQVREVTRQAEEEQEATHDKVFELQR